MKILFYIPLLFCSCITITKNYYPKETVIKTEPKPYCHSDQMTIFKPRLTLEYNKPVETSSITVHPFYYAPTYSINAGPLYYEK